MLRFEVWESKIKMDEDRDEKNTDCVEFHIYLSLSYFCVEL